MARALRRRDFLLALLALPKLRIRRVRMYESPITRPMINQSFHVVTVETDEGITGIGEGGSPDLVRLAAQMLIGEDARRTDALWQLMYRGLFYPAVARSDPEWHPPGTQGPSWRRSLARDANFVANLPDRSSSPAAGKAPSRTGIATAVASCSRPGISRPAA